MEDSDDEIEKQAKMMEEKMKRNTNPKKSLLLKKPKADNVFNKNILKEMIEKFSNQEDNLDDSKPEEKIQKEVEEKNVPIDYCVIPRNKTFTNNSKIELMITSKIHLDLEQVQDNKAGLDLVCVIDNSSSMASNEKMINVQKSMLCILELLKENDRICLILFNDNAQILTPLMKGTKENKIKLEKIIVDIKIYGCTNILSGLYCAFEILKARVTKNNVTAVFLLSDGQDNSGIFNEKFSEIFAEAPKVPISLATFGYGKDHDPIALQKLSRKKQGQFYYIEMPEKILKIFVRALSGVQTLVAQDVDFNLKILDDNFMLTKLYGGEELWEYHPMSNSYKIKQNFLVWGVDYEFFLELEKKPNKEILNGEINFAEGDMQGIYIQNNSYFQKLTKLSIIFGEKEEREENIQFEIGLLRLKTAEAIDNARKNADNSNFDIARQVLQTNIEELHLSKFAKEEEIIYLLEDCKQSLNLCQKPEEYKIGGKAALISKKDGHTFKFDSGDYFGYSNKYQKKIEDKFDSGEKK